MRKLADIILRLYQIFISPIIPQIVGVPQVCRFEESCSNYSRRVIKEYGILYGLSLTVKRLVACQPFIHYGHR